jgi:RIO kinase 1
MVSEENVYDGIYVEECLSIIKSGKEAAVFLCSAQSHTGLEYVAVKVYKPLEQRSFRNDKVYQQGRYIDDARLRRAYKNKSKAGQKVQYSNWITAEWETMTLLHDAGADVPCPYNAAGSAIVMEYIGDPDAPAEILHNVRLKGDEPERAYNRIIRNIRIQLAAGRVHGDLSPFNILHRDSKIWIIDFPQAVDPYSNRDAFGLLLRDIENINKYFRKYFNPPDPYQTAAKLWEQTGRIVY